MIHHNTPASKIKIKCIEKRSHKKKKKSESFSILARFKRKQAKHPSLRQLVKGTETFTYEIFFHVFYNTKQKEKTLSLRPGRRSSNNNTARGCILRKKKTKFLYFFEKKNSKKAKRMREWMLRRWRGRRRRSCSSDLPKLAIIWNWNIISVGSFNHKPSEGLDVKKFHLRLLIKLNGQKKEQ